MKRVIFDIVLFLLVFALPWWITAILGLAGLFLFKNFYEFIVVGAMIFAIFRVPSGRIIASPLWYSLIIVFIFFGSQYLRKIIRFYK